MQVAVGTDVGHARPRNEDAYLEAPDRRVYAVADGMGGHPAGDVASRTALEAVDAALDPARLETEDRMQVLRRALEEAHDRVHDAAVEDPTLTGMGTTAVLVHVDADERLLTLAHVGDSRAYRLDGDGRMRRLTQDHVWDHRFGRTLMQAIGSSRRVEPETAEVKLNPGDRILLCTDGLTDLVPEDQIADIVGRPAPLEEVRDALVDAALTQGGYDNVTVLLIETDAA